MEATVQDVREKIISRIEDLPAMPASAARLLTLLQDPDVEMSDLVSALQLDPGLTTNILRWANSVYFGGQYTISSVKDALVRLGLKRMNQVILASVAAPIVSKPVKGYALGAGCLLQHSIMVAMGTEILGRRLKLKLPDYAFTAGLLHDLGKVVLGTILDVSTQPILSLLAEGHVTFDEAERQILGIDHGEVGAIALSRWNIPEEIVYAARWHHRPEDGPSTSLVTDVVHLADVLSLESGIGAGLDGLNYSPSAAVVSRLRLKRRVAEETLCEMSLQVNEINEMLATYGTAS